VLEGLIAHHDGQLDERMLKLVLLTVSFTVGCPFCVDMNAAGWEKLITPDEIAVLQKPGNALAYCWVVVDGQDCRICYFIHLH